MNDFMGTVIENLILKLDRLRFLKIYLPFWFLIDDRRYYVKLQWSYYKM